MATRADGFTFDRNEEHNRFIIEGFAVDYTGCGAETLADRSAALVTVVLDRTVGIHQSHVVMTLTADQADRLARSLTVQAERARDERAPIWERHEAELVARVDARLSDG